MTAHNHRGPKGHFPKPPNCTPEYCGRWEGVK